MQLSRRELLSALGSGERQPSRIQSRYKVAPPAVQLRYAEVIVQQTQVPLFTSNDPVFGEDGIAKDARYMYLEAATAALNQVEKEDNSVALTIHKVIDFLLSDARLNLKEVEQYKGQVYQLERSNRELREQIWTLKNENAKNIEIVQIGVLRLQEQEEAIQSLSKQLAQQKQLGAHLDAMLKAEQQQRQARELDVVEARQRRDYIVRKNNEMTTDVVALRTAYENALQDLREANDVARVAQEETDLLRRAFDDKSALLALRDEQIKQMEARKNFYGTEMRQQNYKLQDVLMVLVGFLNQLGMNLSEKELFSPELKEIGDNLVQQLLAERSELAFYKKSNISKMKGYSVDNSKAIGQKGGQINQQLMNEHNLHQLTSLFQQQYVKTQAPKNDRAVQTAKKIIGVSKTGLVSVDVFDDQDVSKAEKLVLELSDVDEKQIIEQYMHYPDEPAYIQIKADKMLRQHICRYFVSRNQYAKLAARKNKLGRTIADLLIKKRKAERLVAQLVARFDEAQRKDEKLVYILAASGINFQVSDSSCSEQYEADGAVDSYNAGNDVYSESDYRGQHNESGNYELAECNSSATGKLTNTPYESRSLKTSGRPTDGNVFWEKPLMVTDEQQTTELYFIKCVCIKCGQTIEQSTVDRIVQNDDEEASSAAFAAQHRAYSADVEGNAKFLTTCAAVIRAEREQITEQIQLLTNQYRPQQPDDDRIKAELCKHGEDLSECHDLIMNVLMQKPSGIRYLLQQDNKAYQKGMTAAEELIVKSSTFYQTEQVTRYYATFSRISAKEKNLRDRQGKKALSAGYPELTSPLAIKAEARPDAADYMHEPVKETPAYAVRNDLSQENGQVTSKITTKLRAIEYDTKEQYNAVEHSWAVKHGYIYASGRSNAGYPRCKRSAAVEAIYKSLLPPAMPEEMYSDLESERSAPEQEARPDSVRGSPTVYKNTLASDILHFLKSSNCDKAYLEQLSYELARHPTFAHVVRRVKQLTAPGGVYKRADNGFFSNPFREIANIYTAKRHSSAKRTDGRALYQQVINLQIRMLQAKASRQLVHFATKERERSIALAARAGVVFSASGQDETRRTSARRLNCAELRSVVDPAAKPPAPPLELIWQNKSLKSAILNYCSDFVAQSLSPRLEARVSSHFQAFCSYWQFLRSLRYINRQTLVCEPEIESTALPGVNSRVYYIIVVRQYQAPLERMVAEANAQTIERRGSLFVCVPFKVFIKPVGWIIGLVKQIFSAIDISAATYHRLPELVHQWAAYNYGLSHLVSMLEFHLLANLIFYQTEEPSAELFYFLYTDRLTSDQLEYFAFLQYAIPWNQPGSNEAGVAVARALFSGIDAQMMGQLNEALKRSSSIFETYLVLLRQFYASRVEFSSWVVDRFDGAASLRASEVEQLLHKLIPYAPRETLYYRLAYLSQITPGDVFALLSNASFEGDEIMRHALHKVQAVDKVVELNNQADADFLNRLDMLRSSFYKLYHAGFALGAMQVANQMVSFCIRERDHY